MIGKTLGHYRIVEKIGQGGMGVVYRAHDQRLNRDIALKVLPDATLANEKTRKRFRKEALSLSKLNHPNIETVHDFNTQDGVDFLVIEFIPGITLKEKLTQGPLSEKDIGKLGIQIAEGLEAAHREGVIHLDLKPGNLQVTPEKRLKILDFGLAKLLIPVSDTAPTQSLTELHSTGGTLPYMSPEQLCDENVDERTDIFSLGAVLYEMATGQKAFPERSGPQIIEAILHQVPPSPRVLNRRLSEEMERIICKSLEKDPERRYQSAKELRVDLERLISPTPLMPASIPNPSRWPGFSALFRSRWWALTSSALAIIGTSLFILWLTGSRPALSFESRDWILLTDFDNQSGDPRLEKSLLTAFTVSLEQSTHANVFPRERIIAALHRMGKAPDQKINETIGREICLRENIQGLITSRIDKIGENFVLSARLIEPETGNTVGSYLEQAGNENHIIEALGAIATDLRHDLGESLFSIRRNNLPLPQVTTASLEALKLYVDGVLLWSKNKHGEALQLYHLALEKDPDFAMVHAALGICYSSHIFNDQQKGKEHFEKALELSNRISDRERLFVEAQFASQMGRLEEAIQKFSLYVKDYPDDLNIRYNFARLFMMNRREEEAIRELNEVLRISPCSAGAHINKATSYVKLGKFEEALESYSRGFQLEPTWITGGNLNNEYGFALVAAGDEAKAREIFTMALETPGSEAGGHRSMALLEMLKGKYLFAQEHLQEAILLNEIAQIPITEARNHLFLSLVWKGKGDRAERLKELDKAVQALEKTSLQVWLKSLVGAEYARAEELELGGKLLKEIREQADMGNPQQRSSVHRLEGELELARGNHPRAIELLLRAEREHSRALTLESLANAYLTAGDMDKGIANYETLIGWNPPPFGLETQQRWLAARYRLAKAYHSLGMNVKAQEHLDFLLNMWSDADNDVPLLQEALRFRKEL